MMKRFGWISIVSLLTLLLAGIGTANAEEFVISGNGESSQNNVAINTSSQTTVQQENQADIKNDVATIANTGDNSASGNTGGEIGIQTGDASEQTTIDNSVNLSVVQNDCCPISSSNEVKITGNGEDSHNDVSVSSHNTTTITIDQNAHVDNSITTNANTGNNSADGNVGNVSITTGNITILEKVENENINLALLQTSQPAFVNGSFILKISGNGAESENKIFADWFSDLFINVTNNANIQNIINTVANTGGNSAVSNVGDVLIETGDITIGVAIKNGPINTSIADVSCCPKKEDGDGDGDGEGKPPVGGPPPPPGGGGNGGGGNGGGGDGGRGGEVLAAAAGAILPVTGFNWLLATIANVLMFLFGLYLRRRSGRSPTLAYAFQVRDLLGR